MDRKCFYHIGNFIKNKGLKLDTFDSSHGRSFTERGDAVIVTSTKNSKISECIQTGCQRDQIFQLKLTLFQEGNRGVLP